MKRIVIGSRVKTANGDGCLIDSTVTVEGGTSSHHWAKPGRSKSDPIYNVQLFDGTIETVTDLSTSGEHSMNDRIPYGLRAFLLGH